jgi:hypothetical protein
MSILRNFTNELINLIYMESKKRKNRKKINKIISYITNSALQNIQPYLILIVALLVVLFLMNCFQFYYYIKYKTFN